MLRSRIRNNKGFSLVELMVVVAILGILSAIAIPQINKYMARARQTEAKTNLSAIYTANKAFYAEYNIYDNRFDVIGYRPEGKLRYNLGWDTPATTVLTDYGYTGSTGSGASSAVAHCNVAGATATNFTARGCYVLADGQSATMPATSLTAASDFVAGAAAKISTGTQVDQWTINQVKQLTNVQDGSQ